MSEVEAATDRQCECDPCTYQRPENQGKRCQRPAADHGSVVTSPALCMACLFGCAE